MTDSGTLITRVFTSRGELPVEGASVYVVRHNPDGSQELLSVQISDRNGATEPMTIAAPAPENSMLPDQPSPFALYDIWVDSHGFQLLLIQDVQIFPGVTSVQELPLIPRPEFGDRGTDTVDIPAQNL